jgi:hypothetical protein
LLQRSKPSFHGQLLWLFGRKALPEARRPSTVDHQRGIAATQAPVQTRSRGRVERMVESERLIEAEEVGQISCLWRFPTAKLVNPPSAILK